MPERSAADARILWRTELDPLTVRARARRCSADDPDAFDIRALTGPVTIIKDAMGEDMLVGYGATATRLSIDDGTLIEGPVRLTYTLWGRRGLGRRLLALRQLESLMRLGRVSRGLAAPDLNAHKHWMLLRTLDALAAHHSARAVAIALFGKALVKQDWPHESDYLRMRTRRLIDRARRLAAGGYLGLLGGCG